MDRLDDILNISAIFDIRAETLAANLLAHADEVMEDFDIDQIIIAPKGNQRRRIGRDVEEIKRKYFDNDSVLMLHINRKGLFDTLPQNLFIRLDETYKHAKEKTKAINHQIAEARKFFLPFEQAIFHSRIRVEQLEQKYTETFPKFIHDIWGLSEFEGCLSDRQRFLLCYIIPEAHRMVGDWQLTGLIFEAILQKPVNLNFVPPVELSRAEEAGIANGSKLGADIVLGDTFQDDIPALEVIIKGITNRDLPDFMPEGINRRLLEDLLYSYFLPLDLFVITKIEVTEDSKGFTFGNAILGYNIQFKEQNHSNKSLR